MFLDRITDNIQSFGPVFLVTWIITILSIILRPQRYFNSFLLMVSLFISMLFVSGFLSDDAGANFLLGCYLIVTLALFMVPAFLIINGIQMIRKESIVPAHLLSLGLGIAVGIGEIATVIYVFDLYGFISVGNMGIWVLFIVFSVFYFSFLVLSFVIYSVFIQIMPHRRDLNYVIIHGCGLADGERLTKLLQNRVDKAIEVYNKCKVKPIIIPSGGQGSDEKLSEAQAMKNYLIEKGIPESDIILEDRSATTEENLANSREIIDSREGKKRTALISSNYHVYRCLRLARKMGLKCVGIGAKVAFYYWPSALIREFIAIFLTKGFLIWSLLGYLLFISPLLYTILTP